MIKTEIIILLIGGFLSGAIGSLGVGGGGVLIVFLTFFMNFSRSESSVINLIFFIPIAVFSVIMYLKQKTIDLKTALRLVIPGLLGSGLGVFLSGIVKTDILSKLFGVLLIAASIKTLFSPAKKEDKKSRLIKK